MPRELERARPSSDVLSRDRGARRPEAFARTARAGQRGRPELLGRDGILALQRTAGNSSVVQLLGSGRDRPAVVQRIPNPDDLLAIGEGLAALIAAARTGGLTRQLVAPLRQAARQQHLDASNPRAFRLIETLHAIAYAPVAVSQDAIDAVLTRFAPARADLRLRSAATSTFSPVIGEVREPGHADYHAGTQGLLRAGSRGAMNVLQLDEQAKIQAGAALIDVRIALTIEALASAYARYQRDQPGRSTFLVFLGPEFWFRGPGGPCERADAARVKSAFRAVSLLYPDVLIMPGTIVSGKHYPGYTGADSWYHVRNTAPVFWNGELIHQVDKTEDAGTTSGVAPIPGSAGATELAQRKGTGPSFFTLGDLRVALEICADHDRRRAAREGETSDIHLVTGYGQVFRPDKGTLDATRSTIGLSADSSGSGATATRGDQRVTGEWLDEHGNWVPAGAITRYNPQVYWPPMEAGPKPWQRRAAARDQPRQPYLSRMA